MTSEFFKIVAEFESPLRTKISNGKTDSLFLKKYFFLTFFYFFTVGNKWIGYKPQFRTRPCDLKPNTRYKGVYARKNSF